MSNRTINLDAFAKKQEKIDLSIFNFAEKAEALAELNIRMPFKFVDKINPDNVARIRVLMDENPTVSLLLYSELQSSDVQRNLNPFDVSTTIPLKTSSFVVEPNCLKFSKHSRKTDTEEPMVVHVAGGALTTQKDKPVGLFQAVRILGALVSTTSSTETQVKIADAKCPYRVPDILGKTAKTFLAAQGSITEVMQQCVDVTTKHEGKANIIETLVSAVEMVVPKEKATYKKKVKTGPKDARVIETKEVTELIPLVAFRAAKAEAKWNKQFSHVVTSTKSMMGSFDIYGNTLSVKGQGKFAAATYTGLPMGDLTSFINHKITLDEAGVSIGDSIYVHTSDGVLVAFLRSNYGNKVIGQGSEYPLLPIAETTGKEFDWVYVPKPIKISLTGALSVVKSSLLTLISRSLAIPVKGKLIAYMSPMAFIVPEFEDVFFSMSDGKKMLLSDKLEDSQPTPIDRFPFNDQSVRYETLTNFEDINAKWLPGDIADTFPIKSKYVRNYINAFAADKFSHVKEITQEDVDMIWPMVLKSTLAKEAMLSVRAANRALDTETIEGRTLVSQVHDALVATRHSFQHIMAPIRVSATSWRQCFLYSEGLPKVPFSLAVSKLLTYCRHCCRSIWRMEPATLNVFCINKVKTKPKNVDLASMFETFDSIYAEDILTSLTNYEDGDKDVDPDVVEDEPEKNEDNDSQGDDTDSDEDDVGGIDYDPMAFGAYQ